jgi:lysophospholipase L1-like esterase
VLLVLLVVLGLGEVAARLATERAVGRPFESFDPYSFTGYGIYRENPRYTHPNFIHNRAGFRSLEEFTLEKPENTLRVLALGASVLYAGSAGTPHGASPKVHTKDTITAYLQPLLAKGPIAGGRKVEVINASVNKTRLRMMLPWYVAELGRYEPDVVLLFGTHNDTYPLDHPHGLDDLYYRPESAVPEEVRVELLLNDASWHGVTEKLFRAGSNRSALFAGATRGIERGLRTVNERFAQPAAPVERRDVAVSDVASVDRAVDRYLATLGALISYIEQSGAKPIVFWEYLLVQLEGIKPFSPDEAELAAWLKNTTGVYSPQKIAMRFHVRDRVATYLAKRNVPLIDMQEDFRLHSGTVFNDYLHYTPEGNRFVAEVVARELERILASAPGDGASSR